MFVDVISEKRCIIIVILLQFISLLVGSRRKTISLQRVSAKKCDIYFLRRKRSKRRRRKNRERRRRRRRKKSISAKFIHGFLGLAINECSLSVCPEGPSGPERGRSGAVNVFEGELASTLYRLLTRSRSEELSHQDTARGRGFSLATSHPGHEAPAAWSWRYVGLRGRDSFQVHPPSSV